MQELYVYYKVEPLRIDAAHAAFERLRAAVALRWPGLQGRLLMRPAAAGQTQTWMEVYVWHADHPDVPNAPVDWPMQVEHLAATLAAASESSSQRHVEVFETLTQALV